ncbi:SAM-dependent methyltransferase [Pseudoduganella namucuonensis]|uniref:Methyltransferase domain-containing protein n=1 Tax=Pseudoduganella namucuonensis TaxID=1035707 RepID=A0A1I7LYM8_9BURK|nr:class I SAM-dependent methyltransferase [Pseudoduganella namucuonensis]SFV14778.1 Methyltransferase domain-containing protein [Pseudoduganella namucuonensis]
MNSLQKYYAQCALTYDDIYEQEERQDDLEELQARVAELLSGHTVLELACGSGYWTEYAAIGAKAITAIDSSAEMLALAAERELDEDVVRFELADAMTLPDDVAPGQYTACFAAGWWSHVGRAAQDKYLALLRAKLGKDVLLVLLDSCHVEGVSMPIARTDADGNTYQFRLTADGARHEIMKNYPSDSFIRKRLATAARDVRVNRLEYYWIATARLK